MFPWSFTFLLGVGEQMGQWLPEGIECESQGFSLAQIVRHSPSVPIEVLGLIRSESGKRRPDEV
jgi:hypothetical protein